ncbi:hypothetical protein sos41_26620 [Alphaproteobacteria bacterium SO-S41]|nr:hypothetical protein sos41_26620 [Alphaproteobacteria bacterium SO-S41]
MKRFALLLAAGAVLTLPAGAHERRHGSPPHCPINGIELAAQGQTLTCVCAPGDTIAGVLYGTDRYTADSYMCLAAVHAGAIDVSGGEITVYGGAGCDRFEGTTRNGTTSQDWGPFGLSMWFDDPAPPDCARAKRR